jgi:3-hydroxybutyryl-CoA dehydrogenase
VIEAVNEDFSLKAKIFEQLDKLLQSHSNPQDVILASNTSSISLTKLAARVSNPGNFIGMHFMNPVPVMKLVKLKIRSRSSGPFRLPMRLTLVLRKWRH